YFWIACLIATSLLSVGVYHWLATPVEDPNIAQLQEIARGLEESIEAQRWLREQAVTQYQELLAREQARREQAEIRIAELQADHAALQSQRQDVREEADEQIAALPDMADVALAAMIREELGPVHFEPVGLMFQTDR